MSKLGILIGFVTGAAAGVSGAYIFLKKRFEKKAEDEIAESRRTFSSLCKDIRSGKMSLKNMPVEEEDLTPEKITAKQEEIEAPKPKSDGLAHRSYDRVMEENGYLLYKEEDYDLLKNNPPFQIVDKEFGTADYPELVLTWICKDGLLCDIRDGEVYTEIDELIGEDCHNILNGSEKIDGPLFIRNPFLQLDILVTLERELSYVSRFLLPLQDRGAYKGDEEDEENEDEA